MTDAERAYQAARKAIAEAIATDATDLGLDHKIFRALSAIPNEISNLKKLRHLDLRGTCIRDLSALSELNSIVSLEIDHNRVDDLSPISNMHYISTLTIFGTLVSYLKPIFGLLQIATLDIRETPVGDFADQLPFENLHTIYIGNS